MLKEKIKAAAVEGKLIRKTFHYVFIKLPPLIVRKIDGMFGRIVRYAYVKSAKVDGNKIVFMTYSDDYICNPKYIAEEIIRQKLPWDLVWAVPKKGSMRASHFPPQLRRVRRESYAFVKEVASAKVWIDNSLNFLWYRAVPKKEGQIYIETWHGSMGIKRAGKEDIHNKKWVKTAAKCKTATDYCISNSAFEDDVYRTTHWPTTPILRYGHPRNDYLFYPERMAETREKIMRLYGLTGEEKVLLYAPTFRINGHQDCYDIDFAGLTEALEKRFGGAWVIFLRLHFHDRKRRLAKGFFPENVITVTDYPDMQDMLMTADAGITDYSSWAYDYVLTRRPLFIFATDLEEYNNERGLYFPLESTPFPVADCNEELLRNVRQFDDARYQKRIDEFLEDKGCVEDGHAAERVVEKLKEIMGTEV